METHTIGKLVTFCNFIKGHDIEIPRIQRDYTYGSGTEKTEEVLGKLLSDIFDALTGGSEELILDFVYGSRKYLGGNFEPLDGQQRLTTLFLLHLYASWGNSENMPKLRFDYSTRDSTAEFCQYITDSDKFKYDFNGSRVDEQIMDCAFWRASFGDDPSVRSMLNVLVRIEDKFKDLCRSGELASALVNNCNVKFYCLDFGPFGLSDDLYVKMNSRGKTLTAYEIFKSQIEKYIDVVLDEKELKYEFGRKFDTEYTDLIWREMGNDRCAIDDAFVMLFSNILSIRNFTRDKNTSYLEEMGALGDYLPPTKNETRKNVPSWYIDKCDIEFIMDFFRVLNVDNDRIWTTIFYQSEAVCGENNEDGKIDRIRLFKTSVNLFRVACRKKLTNAERVMLYAEYYALKKHGPEEFDADVKTWAQSLAPMRHIRNLVENSDDELARPAYISDILKDVETILDGNILSLQSSGFNTNQFKEEKAKAANPELWKRLYHYENHDVLRGALGLLSEAPSEAQPFHPVEFRINEEGTFKMLLSRLEKIEHIFNDSVKDIDTDRYTRAALLSAGYFGQIYSTDINNDRDNRMVGHLPGSWRLLLTRNNRFRQAGMLEVLDSLDCSQPLAIRQLSARDWRYYATADGYYQNVYVAYSGPWYGYFYIKDAERPLEVFILQSTSCAEDNVMWKLLNLQLWHKLVKNNALGDYQVGIGNRQAAPALIIKDLSGKELLSVDGVQEGWKIGSDSFDTEVKSRLESLGYSVEDNIVNVPDNTDYITFGGELVKAILA